MEATTSPIKIVFLFCYFGKFPWYFSYFLKSCSCNPTVDFIIITDNEYDQSLPANIRWVKMTLQDLRELADEKMGFKTALNNPYKLCDFKPAFGLLFGELIAGYDFWGQGDIDIIFGDIRSVITDNILQEYDVISGRPEYLTGFFSLFRNTEKMNNLFRNSKDYKKVYQDPENYCFDECNWNYSQLWRGKSIFDIESEIESMTYVLKKLDRDGEIRAYFKMIATEGITGKLQWNKRELTYNKNDARLLYHFITFKRLEFLHIPRWKNLPDTIFINSFYISRFRPTSIPGRLMSAVLYSGRFFYRQYLKANQFVKWLQKIRTASRQPGHFVVHDITGTYKREDWTIQIRMGDGHLLADWQGIAPIPLLHITGHKFISGRFKIEDIFNIDVEFRYDAKRSKYALHIIPFQATALVLYQCTTPV